MNNKLECEPDIYSQFMIRNTGLS